MRVLPFLLVPAALAAAGCANLPFFGQSGPTVTTTAAPPGAAPGTPTDELPDAPAPRVAAPTPATAVNEPAIPAIVAPPIRPGSAGQAPAAPSAAPTYPGAPATAVGGGLPPAPAASRIAMEPGLYRCELNRRVLVRRIAADGQSVVVNWSNRDHTLQAVVSRAGALRYDDEQTGLAWITIPGKSILLDTKKGQQLANECRL